MQSTAPKKIPTCVSQIKILQNFWKSVTTSLLEACHQVRKLTPPFYILYSYFTGASLLNYLFYKLLIDMLFQIQVYVFIWTHGTTLALVCTDANIFWKAVQLHGMNLWHVSFTKLILVW